VVEPLERRRAAGIADYSVVRALILVSEPEVVKPKHLVRNPNGEIAAFVDIRIVRHWPYTPGTHRLRTEDHDFPDGAGEIPSGAGNAPGGTSIHRSIALLGGALPGAFGVHSCLALYC
jgi:hypothetical protein